MSHLDTTPEGEDLQSSSPEFLRGKTKEEKLRLMDDLLLDTYIMALKDKKLKANDLGAVVTYLKNNKEVREVSEESAEDEIDKLLEEAR
ncbi:MAG: hypothetical protein ACPG9K_01110 [Poseidonibacter sp.]